MSIIITGMDIPESCCECPICHPKGKDEPWNYACFQEMLDINLDKWDKQRHSDCKMKTIEGLIEKIKEVKQYKGKSGNPYIDVHDRGLDRYFDLGIDRAIKIIKEYCEVKK